MKTKKWYFKSNYELYNVLYEDDRFILVQNANNKLFSFGVTSDFDTLLGFPVNQSCLTKNGCINTLKRFAAIDKKYKDVNDTTNVYKKMILALKEMTGSDSIE